MQIELKPCPFCGSENVRVVSQTLEAYFLGYIVHCDGCGVETKHFFDEQKAAEAWNRRADDAAEKP